MGVHRSTVLLAVAAALWFAQLENVRASQVIPALDPALEPEDPLQISDLIVRGVVENVTPSQFDISSGEPGTTSVFVRSSVVRVKVWAVLRGSWNAPKISMVVLFDYDGLVKGREYIFCGSWRKDKRTFVGGPNIGIYANGGRGRWIKRPRPSAPFPTPDTLTTRDVRSRLERGSLRYVTRQADVILTGTVVSERDSAYVKDGQRGRTKCYTVKVGDVLKGRATARYITMAIPQRGEYIPVWIRYTPPVRVDQEWLLFLEREEWGLYPFAGRNSMFLIDGDSLIYNAGVRCPRTRAEAMAQVRYQVRGEKH